MGDDLYMDAHLIYDSKATMNLKFASLKPVIEAVENELSMARTSFPGNKKMLHALHEEVGEVAKAMLNQYHAINKHGKHANENADEYNDKIKKELIQVIVMAIRVLTEGDADFPFFPFIPK